MYRYFSVFFIFRVAFKGQFVRATLTEQGWAQQEVDKVEAARLLNGRTLHPSPWDRFSLIGVAVVVAIIVAVSSSSHAKRDASGNVTQGGDSKVGALRTGDCLPTMTGGNTKVSDLNVVPCSQAHQAEVFYAYDLSGSFPGSDAVGAEVQKTCANYLRTNMKLTPADKGKAISPWTLYPDTQETWDSNKHAVCILALDSGTTTSPIAVAK
ncbi:hypothetical protein Back2_11530 [Nocardioides baekrokdamisoli]|uniref:Septum formation-related domain-containing protein n=1 Tax=Nocardioides baekrokdamisoli TaxID=1804624 RepID=A0A3G9IET4_9ACTN|nr:septum formation family protein [Nocardioides baekrokdamisoli]BBH16866.1 hypothetical protein Back2_11530 [Nocardioides baekrokdamisoli]